MWMHCSRPILAFLGSQIEGHLTSTWGRVLPEHFAECMDSEIITIYTIGQDKIFTCQWPFRLYCRARVFQTLWSTTYSRFPRDQILALRERITVNYRDVVKRVLRCAHLTQDLRRMPCHGRERRAPLEHATESRVNPAASLAPTSGESRTYIVWSRTERLHS
jgi:hypothetical protein